MNRNLKRFSGGIYTLQRWSYLQDLHESVHVDKLHPQSYQVYPNVQIALLLKYLMLL